MRIATVREFRDKATDLLRSKSPVLVTRRGRLAGVYFPSPESTLPLEFKKEFFAMLSADLGRDLSADGTTESEVLEDFEAWRKKRRATRRGR